MLTPPADFPPDAVAQLLRDGWGIEVAKIAYRAVGFGSHHWAVTDIDRRCWFVTADALPDDRTFDALHAALATVTELDAAGARFVVAPVPATDGAPLLRSNRGFGIACYPHLDGRSFAWDDFAPELRATLLSLVVALHSIDTAAAPSARTDDFALAHRDDLVVALDDGIVRTVGPYAAPAATLVLDHAAAIRRLLARNDTLADELRARSPRTVVTHGEPHPGNMMRTPVGSVLIDWDTALVAPPERDLWSLDPGDGSVLGRYERATGYSADPRALEYYRIRWDLADIGVYLSRFRAPHTDTSDDAKSWANLCTLVDRVPA